MKNCSRAYRKGRSAGNPYAPGQIEIGVRLLEPQKFVFQNSGFEVPQVPSCPEVLDHTTRLHELMRLRDFSGIARPNPYGPPPAEEGSSLRLTSTDINRLEPLPRLGLRSCGDQGHLKQLSFSPRISLRPQRNEHQELPSVRHEIELSSTWVPSSSVQAWAQTGAVRRDPRDQQPRASARPVRPDRASRTRSACRRAIRAARRRMLVVVPRLCWCRRGRRASARNRTVFAHSRKIRQGPGVEQRKIFLAASFTPH